jgi:uncharacterized protein
MHIMWDWDEDKRQTNRAKHGVDFSEMALVDWVTATHFADTRWDYGERRVVTLGYIGDRLHVIAWTQRGPTVRIITMRKANAREQKVYRATRFAH